MSGDAKRLGQLEYEYERVRRNAEKLATVAKMLVVERDEARKQLCTKDVEVRRLACQLDSVSFHNTQLSKRIEAFQQNDDYCIPGQFALSESVIDITREQIAALNAKIFELKQKELVAEREYNAKIMHQNTIIESLRSRVYHGDTNTGYETKGVDSSTIQLAVFPTRSIQLLEKFILKFLKNISAVAKNLLEGTLEFLQISGKHVDNSTFLRLFSEIGIIISDYKSSFWLRKNRFYVIARIFDKLSVVVIILLNILDVSTKVNSSRRCSMGSNTLLWHDMRRGEFSSTTDFDASDHYRRIKYSKNEISEQNPDNHSKDALPSGFSRSSPSLGKSTIKSEDEDVVVDVDCLTYTSTMKILLKNILIFLRTSIGAIECCVKSNRTLYMLEYLKDEIVNSLLTYLSQLECTSDESGNPSVMKELAYKLKDGANMFNLIVKSEIETLSTYNVFSPAYFLNCHKTHGTLERDIYKNKTYNALISSRIRPRVLQNPSVTVMNTEDHRVLATHCHMLQEQLSYLTEKLSRVSDEKEALLFKMRMLEESEGKVGGAEESEKLTSYLKERLTEYSKRYIHAAALVNSLKMEIIALRNRNSGEEFVLPLSYLDFKKEVI